MIRQRQQKQVSKGGKVQGHRGQASRQASLKACNNAKKGRTAMAIAEQRESEAQKQYAVGQEQESQAKQEAPRRQPGGTQETPRRHQEAPRSAQRHSGGTQEAPKKQEAIQEAPRGTQKASRGTQEAAYEMCYSNYVLHSKMKNVMALAERGEVTVPTPGLRVEGPSHIPRRRVKQF